jgi:hypothetical protein
LKAVRIVEAVPLPIIAGLLARIAVCAGLARLSAKWCSSPSTSCFG